MQRRSSSSVRVYYPKSDPAKIIEAIAGRMGELQRCLPIKLVVLFGSYARGNYTVSSDIDLLVIYGGDGRDNAYALVRKALKVPRLEPHVYSEEEYKQSKRMVDAMARGGRVLYSA